MRFAITILSLLCTIGSATLAGETGAATAPADNSDNGALAIPGGHVYLGISTTALMLPIGMKYVDSMGFAHTGSPDGGLLWGAVLSVELERALFLGSVELGFAGSDGLPVRASLLAGYTLTEGNNAPYIAAGISGYALGGGDFGGAVSEAEGFAATFEGGVLLGRSRRFGRLTAAATAMLPVTGMRGGPWNPWLGLVLRVQL